MNNMTNILLYLFMGLVGGYIGDRLKMPAGALVGAMVTVIVTKLILKSEWELPANASFIIQALVGIMVGVSFQPSFLTTFYKIVIPVIVSCVILVGTGILIAILFTKLGILDISTGYMGTSPGAMTVLLSMALEGQVDATVIACFHLFRVIFVILTAPIILKIIQAFA